MISDHYQSSLVHLTRVHPGIYKITKKWPPLKAAKKDGPGHIFDIKTQHGHLLLLSEVLKNCKINESHQDILFEIQKIPQEISKTTRWKGDAGSLTRSSSLIMCAHLIENYPKFISDEDRKIIAQLAIDSIKYLNRIEENKHDLILDAAIFLFDKLGHAYIDLDVILKKNVWQHDHERTRGGLALVLSKIKIFESEAQMQLVIDALNSRINITSALDKDWTLSRRDALLALAEVVYRGKISGQGQSINISTHQNTFLTCLTSAINDYTRQDNVKFGKGDVGFHLRKCALELIVDEKINQEKFYPIIVRELGSRLAKVREAALRSVKFLNFNQISENDVSGHLKSAERYFMKDFTGEGMDSAGSDVLSVLCQAKALKNSHLAVPEGAQEEECLQALAQFYSPLGYTKPALESLLLCAGDMTISLAKEAEKALLSMELSSQVHGLLVLQIIEENIDNDRVLVPVMSSLEKLFSQGLIFDYQPLILKFARTLAHNKNKNIKKLIPAIDCLISLLNYQENVDNLKIILKKITFLLVHSIPRIRDYTAEKFKDCLVLVEDIFEENFEHFDSEVLEELLENTEWVAMGKMDVLKSERNKIVEMFGLN